MHDLGYEEAGQCKMAVPIKREGKERYVNTRHGNNTEVDTSGGNAIEDRRSGKSIEVSVGEISKGVSYAQLLHLPLETGTLQPFSYALSESVA